MHKTRIQISADVRKKLIDLLQARLADSIDLSLAAKTAHWNVRGPDFFQLHELFDKVHEAADGIIDEIAERIGQLGGNAEGTPAAVAQRTKNPAYPLQIASGPEHIAALANTLAATANAMRLGIDEAGKLGDQGTADLLTEGVREFDKHLWFVEAHEQADK